MSWQFYTRSHKVYSPSAVLDSATYSAVNGVLVLSECRFFFPVRPAMINSPLLVVWYVWRKSFIGYCWGIAEVLAQLLHHHKNTWIISTTFRLPQLQLGMLPSRVFLEVHLKSFRLAFSFRRPTRNWLHSMQPKNSYRN